MDRVLRKLAEARPFDVPPRPPRDRARPAWKMILLPATAFAAAVAVVAVFTLAGGPPRTAEHVTDQVTEAAAPKDVRQVLLAAAAQAQTAQPSTGRYWLHKLEAGNVYTVGDYKVLGRVAQEIWNPLTAEGNYVHCSRWLGFQPLTDADRAAWQRAGSPTTLDVDTKRPTRTLTLDPGPRDCRSRPGDGADLFYVAGVEYTYAQVQALPTDPARLRETLRQAIPDVDAELLYIAASDILLRVLAPPAVRAAAYRMLADLPGIRLIENVTDQMGRSGSGVEHTYGPNGPWRIRLVIDLSTGQTLAHEQRYSANGEVVFYEAITGSNLTDQDPPSA